MPGKEKKTAFLKYLLPVRSVIFVLVFIIGASIADCRLSGIMNWWSLVASIVNIATIVSIIALAKRTGTGYLELINYRKDANKPGKNLLLAFAAAVIGMSGMYLAGLLCYGKIMPAVSVDIVAPLPVVLAVINLIVLPATVAFAEDGLYLGCGVNNIRNDIAAVLVPAFFYALQHCFIPTLWDARYMLYRFLSFLPLTVIFCLYYRKKRDPVPIMLGHALLDLATASMILATSVVPGLYDSWKSMA